MEGAPILLISLHLLPFVIGSPCTIQFLNSDTLVTCRGLPPLDTSLPTSLPDNVTWLDISHNAITELNVSALSRFHHLHYLDMSFNSFRIISLELFRHCLDLQVLNLSENKLQSLDLFSGNSIANAVSDGLPGESLPTQNGTSNGMLRVLNNLQQLMLSQNNIRVVSPQTFDGLQSLRVLNMSHNGLSTVVNDSFGQLSNLEDLDLSANSIRNLESGSLNGLNRLKVLRLSFNHLQYDYISLPPELFVPVGDSLTSLYLEGNADTEGTYPEETFKALRSLLLLKIDSFLETSFGEGFAEMHELRTLDLSYNCIVRALSNNTFLNLSNSHLETLDMTHCKLFKLEACTFCPLRHLSVLRLAWSGTVPLHDVLRAFYGLQNHNVSLVDITGIDKGRGSGMPFIDNSVTEFLLNTCISNLNLSGCGIGEVKPRSFVRSGSRFNKCIRNLDLSHNMITSNNAQDLLLFLRESDHLEICLMQEQKEYRIGDFLFSMFPSKRQRFSRYHLSDVSLTLTVSQHLYLLNISGSFNADAVLPRRISFQYANSLKIVDWSYNFLIGCQYHIVGFDHVQVLNLSGNNCYFLSEDFFDSFPLVEDLCLQRMDFDHVFIASHGHRLFRNLIHLQRLDLSNNALEHLPSGLLNSQSNMRELFLANNMLQRLSVEMIAHMNLTLLDMTDNALTRLEDNVQRALDEMAERSTGHFHLNLHGNPFVCTCETLYFMRWLSETKVILDDSGNYTCVTESGGLSSSRQVADDWMYEWRRCVGPAVFWWSIAGTLFLLSVIGGSWGVAVNITRIRFLLTVFRHLKLPEREHFTKDAYLAYSNRDWELACVQLKRVLEDQRGVRLLIKDLPIDATGTQFYQLPGDNECEKILEHIDMCWKVVLVVTDALSRDPMAGFMVRAALQSISDRMPERVVVVVMGTDSIPEVASLKTLLESVPEKNVFYVTQTVTNEHPVWDRISLAILQ